MRVLHHCIALSILPLMSLSAITTADDVGLLTVSSKAFQHEGVLPKRYSCNGEDISPPLTVSNIPEGTKTLVLIHDDPDASYWMHWVLYDVPVTGDTVTLAESASTKAVWPDGTMQGYNGWGQASYGGACPPDGTHQYLFKFYALDAKLNLKKKRSAYKVKKAMKKHIIAKGELMASYP
ncbi:MAG: Raf kinase inhibitor-like YbhB/YbcL family protein [Kiritimatiellia bacterium]|jgi:Raf kinase inhibitor-like YbhB/YbcL family protein